MFWKLRVTVLCTLALLAVAARAATRNVGPGQTYTTIQSAINAASDFDTVLVAPGTYTENIDLLGKWITVTSSGGAAVTTIDGSGKSAPAVTIELGGTHIAGTLGAPTFSGFTVQNGGTGAATSPTGGIYVNLSSGLIANNVLTHNHCAGLWVVESLAPPTVQNNEVDSTTDNFDCPTGGGSGIVVSRYGSGCVNCKGVPIPITGNTIQNNVQGGHEVEGGGGITILSGLSGAQIQNNTVAGNATAGIGGGIWLGISNVEVVQNLIYNNQAVCGGAGIATERTQYTAGTGTLLLANNTLYGNTLSGAACTASQAGNGSQLLFADEGSLTYPAVVVNNIVSSNSAQTSIACAFAKDAAAGLRDTPVFDHNLLFNSSGPVLDTASCTDPNALLTDLNADPQFVNAASYNFQLQSTSPAIDTGNNSALPLDNDSIYFSVNTTTDFAGNPRLADATGKGYATIDMGAYEFTGTADTQQTNVSLGATNVNGEVFLLTAAGGSSVNLKAVISSPVGGATGCVGPVSLLEDGTALASANVVAYTNTATFNNVFLAPGTHHFAASYAGQGPCSAGVSVPLIYIVSNYAPTLSLGSSPNPALLGQPVTFTVYISSGDPAQGGPITLTDTTTNTLLATLMPSTTTGFATFTTSSLALGPHAITASYAGDATHNAATAGLTQYIVNGNIATTMMLASSENPSNAGDTVTFTATPGSASGTPTGSIQFSEGATVYATVPVNYGIAQWSTGTLSAGTHTITATLVPTGLYTANSASLLQTVNGLPTTTTLQIVPPSPTAGVPVQLIATVTPVTPIASPVPMGMVTFTETFPPTALALLLGRAQVGTNGVAPLPPILLPAGTDYITCSYSGDPTFAMSACTPATITVSPGSTGLTLASNTNPAIAGAPITFTMHLSFNGQAAPAGQSVTLAYATGTVLQIIPLTTDATGTATYTLPQGLAAGNYTFDATFFATSNQSYASAGLAELVIAPSVADFTLSGPGTVTVLTASNGVTPLSLTSVGGFAANVALSCSATIPQYTCSVAPGSVTLPANGGAGAALTLQWNGLAQGGRENGARIMLAALLLLGMVGVRRRRRLFAVLCLALVASAISACGDAAYPTVVGSFPVTVTATSGATVHTLSVTANLVQ